MDSRLRGNDKNRNMTAKSNLAFSSKRQSYHFRKMIVLALFFVQIYTPYARAVEVTEAVNDHLAQASLLEQKADEQAAFIKTLEEMKLTGPTTRFYVDEKLSPKIVLDEFEKRCDELIISSTNLKNNLLDTAAWHRRRVTELQNPESLPPPS